MKNNSLAEKLQEAGVPAEAYTLYSKARDETLTIEFEDGYWIVYYYERGLRTGLREFPDCKDAEEYFFDKITQWF